MKETVYLSEEQKQLLVEDYLLGRRGKLGLALREGEMEEPHPTSLRALAEKYGISHQTVANIVASRGYPSIRRRSAKDIDEDTRIGVMEDYKNGISYTKIASRHFLSMERVRRIILDLKFQ